MVIAMNRMCCKVKHALMGRSWRCAGQGHQHILAEEVSLAASALSSEEVRGSDLPAVKMQLLAIITNLISLAGMRLMTYDVECCTYARMHLRECICLGLPVSKLLRLTPATWQFGIAAAAILIISIPSLSMCHV